MVTGSPIGDDGSMTDTPMTAAPTADARNKAVLSHLSAFVMLIGIPSLIGPLVAYLVWKDDPFVVEQAKEALNFNISIAIYSIVAAFSLFLLVGFVLLPAVLIGWLVLTIVAAMNASNGVNYRYPLTIRFVS
jgi:uncharacterized protein